MKIVSVSELKANLSKYLRVVRLGGEVQVLDRGVPVARLVGLAVGSEGGGRQHRERLIAAGLVRPGRGDAAAILETTPLELPVSLVEALDEERSDRL